MTLPLKRVEVDSNHDITNSGYLSAGEVELKSRTQSVVFDVDSFLLIRDNLRAASRTGVILHEGSETIVGGSAELITNGIVGLHEGSLLQTGRGFEADAHGNIWLEGDALIGGRVSFETDNEILNYGVLSVGGNASFIAGGDVVSDATSGLFVDGLLNLSGEDVRLAGEIFAGSLSGTANNRFLVSTDSILTTAFELDVSTYDGAIDIYGDVVAGEFAQFNAAGRFTASETSIISVSGVLDVTAHK